MKSPETVIFFIVDIDRTAFAKGLRRALPDRVVAWRGREAFAGDLAEMLEREFERCTSREFADGFAEACPVEGCEPEDYLQNVVEIGPEHRALIGIRFHGHEGFPFVDIVATTAPLDGPAVVKRAVDRALESYGSFDPERVRLLRSSDDELPGSDAYDSRPDQHIHVGSADEIARDRQMEGESRIEIRPVDDVSNAADFAADCYESFLREHPELASRLSPADRESLADCRESGLAVYAHIDGQRAGLLATCDALGPVARGQCVVEEVLAAEFRSHGLAPAFQRLAIERLSEDHPGSLVWGTIDHANLPSRATAARVGRPAVAARHWLWPR